MSKEYSGRIGRWALTTMMAICLALPAWAQATEMSHGQAIRHDTSPPLSEMAGNLPAAAAGGNVEINPIEHETGLRTESRQCLPRWRNAVAEFSDGAHPRAHHQCFGLIGTG